jgi:hypothetical protein
VWYHPDELVSGGRRATVLPTTIHFPSLSSGYRFPQRRTLLNLGHARAEFLSKLFFFSDGSPKAQLRRETWATGDDSHISPAAKLPCEGCATASALNG